MKNSLHSRWMKSKPRWTLMLNSVRTFTKSRMITGLLHQVYVLKLRDLKVMIIPRCLTHPSHKSSLGKIILTRVCWIGQRYLYLGKMLWIWEILRIKLKIKDCRVFLKKLEKLKMKSTPHMKTLTMMISLNKTNSLNTDLLQILVQVKVKDKVH